MMTIQLSRLTGNLRSSLRYAASITAILMLSACASSPQPPTAELQAAELAIANADQARAADHAPLELREAREKLTSAREDVQKKDMVGAKRRANEARVTAELALAKANEAKAKKVNEEMKESTEALKQEMQRNIGVPK